MLTIDSSAVLALMDARDKHHKAARKIFKADAGPVVVPIGILAEITYLLEERVGGHAVARFTGDLADRAYATDCGDENFRRIGELVERYSDLPLSFADAVVIACAERNGRRVLAFDRDFEVVAREGTFLVVSSS